MYKYPVYPQPERLCLSTMVIPDPSAIYSRDGLTLQIKRNTIHTPISQDICLQLGSSKGYLLSPMAVCWTRLPYAMEGAIFVEESENLEYL